MADFKTLGGMNKGEDIELCKNCPDAPTTYEEYCSQYFCPNAYTDNAKNCGFNLTKCKNCTLETK